MTKRAGENTVSVKFECPPSLKARFAEAAEKLGASSSKMIRILMESLCEEVLHD